MHMTVRRSVNSVGVNGDMLKKYIQYTPITSEIYIITIVWSTRYIAFYF